MSNSGGVYTWSKTPGDNAGADNTVNWQEGQAPSSINDSARNMMTSVAKWRDDISGAIVTGGTSAAYTVSTNQAFDTAAHMHGQVIAFTPHATNAAGPVTMTVDAFANLPLRTAPNTELLAGVLIQGTPYLATYNHSDGALYLQGYFGNPHVIPLGGLIDFIGTTAPNSRFVLPFGQAISRTTYSALFAMVGTTYGTGDGTTTFNIPDLRGRVSAGKDDMGGSAASRLTSTHFGTSAAALGAVGGAESHALQTTEIPSHTHVNTLTDPGHVHPFQGVANFTASTSFNTSYDDLSQRAGTLNGKVLSATTGISINNAAAGGGGAHKNVQPTIIVNKILRII